MATITEKHIELISNELNLAFRRVSNTIELLQDKATVPFISRYRKERTGNLDEMQIVDIKNRMEKFIELEERRETVLATIEKQGKLNDELREQINSIFEINELEDIYLPYKPKRKTRASVAREHGLQPLATEIFQQRATNLKAMTKKYICEKFPEEQDVLQGARDIIAEQINENMMVRSKMRNLFKRSASIHSKLIKDKAEEGEKYRDYFDYNESLKKCPSHRILAIQRAEKEGILRINIMPPEEDALKKVQAAIKLKIRHQACYEQIELAGRDSYKRLLQPAMETEFKKLLKEKADKEAIRVFTANLRQLLMSPPLGQKRVLAIDPGFRSGCKLVCLDEHGTLLHNETIYPHAPQKKIKDAMRKLTSLISAYNIEAIAIGNGTAGRETETLIRKKMRFDRELLVFSVNESGASVYSASSVGREEFPEYDVTVRGAVSIGRRLMDPLAELVKIDPKSIGVGQYQHDVDQNELKKSLDQTVESCVNLVGVNVNTASRHLLTYVAGLGPQLAENIIVYRNENGAFISREQLNHVKRMGGKTFEQCAGFLRIPDASNPLDDSAVHPEAYPVVKQMAQDLSISMHQLISNDKYVSQIEIEKYVTPEIGIPTLKDILKELAKPGRDPRPKIKYFEFDANIRTIDDLQTGMLLNGIVTNITNFGAFVDLGIKTNGLLHISNISDTFISNPADVLSINQHVKVKVIDIDTERKRIQLSMKELES